MIFYDSFGPKPRIVRMYMLERGSQFDEVVKLNLFEGENRRPPYTDINPAGQTPGLVLNDGTAIGESLAICEYVEEVMGSSDVFGGSPEARAQSRMWTLRVDQKVTEPMFHGFYYSEGIEIFKSRVHVIPDAAEGIKKIAQQGYAWFDEQIGGGPFLTGDRISLGDIALYTSMDFAPGVAQPVPDTLENLNAWYRRVSQRPSAAASLWPDAPGEMRG